MKKTTYNTESGRLLASDITTFAENIALITHTLKDLASMAKYPKGKKPSNEAVEASIEAAADLINICLAFKKLNKGKLKTLRKLVKTTYALHTKTPSKKAKK